ncbi:hypothetical protein ACFVX9_30475 [Kitasatospora sp. NPDC058243]|uniref:hypothetical protein n=1 Tax=Kitasatospora sp. NPDC058243 TaxID=3346397 RepID=UPI0036DC1057
MIKPRQIYTDCDPRGGATIRIVEYTPGSNRADVVDATTGKRPRSVLASRLHSSAVTKAGKPRRAGYALVQDTEEPQP